VCTNNVTFFFTHGFSSNGMCHALMQRLSITYESQKHHTVGTRVGGREEATIAHTMPFNCINRVGMSYCFIRASSTKASIDSGSSAAL